MSNRMRGGAAAAILAAVWLVAACGAGRGQALIESGPAATPAAGSAAAATPAAPAFNCLAPPQVTSDLPADTNNDDQPDVNCFAWQSFIALNWPADPNMRGMPDKSKTAQDFGQPGDTSATVWQTFKLPDDVFLPRAAAPAAWDAPDIIPGPCAASGGDKALPVMRMVSKFSDLVADDVEATGQMLIDQNSNPVHFEKRMNVDEYDYIVSNTLYDANSQAQVAKAQGIRLPTDAIEIKAAWRVLAGQPDAITSRYKTSTVLLYDPDTNTCSPPTLMGLVGLHILRQTQSMQQLMWSTFEQIDNLDDADGQPPAGVPYSFYNPSCHAPAPCTANAPPAPTPPPPAAPTYEPVQVTRAYSIPGDMHNLNLAAQQLIRQQNNASVWQYYQLVNVLWPQTSQPNYPGANITVPVPLGQSGFVSEKGQPVSNVTLETYVQNRTCASSNCHASAAVAPSKAAGCQPVLAAGLSFVFSFADTPDQFASSCGPSATTPASAMACALCHGRAAARRDP